MRHCSFHEKRTEHLLYRYPIPGDLGMAFEGWLLCAECDGHYQDGDWEYFKGLMEGRTVDKRRKAKGAW